MCSVVNLQRNTGSVHFMEFLKSPEICTDLLLEISWNNPGTHLEFPDLGAVRTLETVTVSSSGNWQIVSPAVVCSVFLKAEDLLLNCKVAAIIYRKRPCCHVTVAWSAVGETFTKYTLSRWYHLINFPKTFTNFSDYLGIYERSCETLWKVF